MRRFGLDRDTVDVEQCLAIEPALAQCRAKIVGGSMTPSDESGDAHRFTQELAQRCAEAGEERGAEGPLHGEPRHAAGRDDHLCFPYGVIFETSVYMRTLLLTILGCLAFTAGHAGAAQNPAPETAGAQQDAKARGAHLRMEVAGHDFGDVPRKGGDLVREFTFTNDGTAPLVVTRVITSCSCLKASFPKRPVPPGGQGVIRITYEPHKSEPGVFNKVIQVYSNSVDGRDVITVQGNSIEGQPRGKVKTEKVKVKYK
jgi:hypothetical protein